MSEQIMLVAFKSKEPMLQSLNTTLAIEELARLVKMVNQVGQLFQWDNVILNAYYMPNSATQQEVSSSFIFSVTHNHFLLQGSIDSWIQVDYQNL